MRPIFISVYHPASNPCEKVMKVLGKLCRLCCYRRHRAWGRYIQGFQHVLNDLPNSSTSMPPVLVLKTSTRRERCVKLCLSIRRFD